MIHSNFLKSFPFLVHFRNYIVRIIMFFPGLWWFVLNFFNNHFMCSVIGIVYDSQNRILLLDHKYRPHSPAFPSGWLRKGENPLDTIVREIKEETNFNVQPKRLLSIGSSKKFLHLEFVVEVLYLDGEFIPSNEVSNFSWVSPTDVIDTLNVFCCILNDNGVLNESNFVSTYTVKWF